MLKSKFTTNQLIGVVGITAFISFYTLSLYLYEKANPSYADTHVTVSGADGDGRRGMLVLWILLILVFTLINLAFVIRRYFRRPK
jgi:hypothetical protein